MEDMHRKGGGLSSKRLTCQTNVVLVGTELVTLKLLILFTYYSFH